MEPDEVEEYVQNIFNTPDFEVKSVDVTGDRIHIVQTDMEEDGTALLSAVLFDQIDTGFKVVTVDEYESDQHSQNYYREDMEEAMKRFVELVNAGSPP